jgi:hypothetical protein
VDCGESWLRQRIEAAIAKGAHASAEAPGAADACQAEALKRVATGSCRLINWIDIRDVIPPNLKVSTIAAVRRKSRLYRMILDLSYQIKINGKKLQSVNDTSDKNLAPQHAMYELGNVIPRLIWAMATSNDSVTLSCPPKSISKTVTGECASTPMMHGILLTSSQVENPVTPFNWSSLKHSRWGGANLHHFSARHRKDHGAPPSKTPILGK